MKKTILSILLLGLVQLGWAQCSDPSGFYLEPLDPVFCTGQDNQLNIMPSNWNTPVVPPFFSYWSASWEYSTDGVNWTTDPLAAGSPFLVPASLPQPYYYRPVLECSDDGSTYTLPFYLVEPIINAYIVGNMDLCPSGETELTLDIPYYDIDTLNVTSVQWNLDGDPSGLPSANTVTATQEGTYYVNLVIQNSIGNCFVASPQFEVEPCANLCQGTPVGGNAIPNLSTVCSGATFQLSLSGASQIATQTYQWQSSPDGFLWTDISGQTNATLSTSTTTNTYYRCVVTCGPSTDNSTYAFVSVFDAVAASGPNCAVGTNIIVVPTDADTYVWYLDGQVVAGADSASLPANSAGSYTVAITKGSCTLTTDPVVVNPLPDPTVTPQVNQFCEGDSVQLSAVAGMSSYQWFKVPSLQGNISMIVGATGQTYMANSAGIYFVTVTNQFGCSNSANLTTFAEGAVVTVNPNPLPVIISSNGMLSVVGAFATYQWYFNGGLISGANGPTYTPTEDGTYTVEVTDDNGCHGTSGPLEVIIPPAYPKIVINEFNYYHPNGNVYDYIELKNVDTVAWDMADFKIQLIEQVNGNVNVYSELVDPVMAGILAPNDYFVIGAANGVPNQDISPFSEIFDNIKGDTGAIVLFFDNDQIDRVSYGLAVPNYSEGAPIVTPDSSIKAFARIPDGVDSGDNASDFQLTCGTSGSSNTSNSNCIATLLINEIMTDTILFSSWNGIPTYPIFDESGIELYNPNSFAVSLYGYKVKFESSSDTVTLGFTGSDSTLYPIEPNLLTVPAHGFRTMGRTVYNGSYIQDWPYNGDISYYYMPILYFGYTISLYNPDNQLVDRVGYGSGYVGEGTPIAQREQGHYNNYSRVPNGMDTDNNAADFQLVCATVGQSNASASCDFTSVEDMETEFPSNLFPNPCSEILFVEWAGSTSAQFIVTDVQGRSVLNGKLSNGGSVQTKNLRPGLFILKLTDENGSTSSQLFVKQ